MFYLSLVAGKAVAVRVGGANSPIVGCMSLPSPILPSTSATTPPLAQTTATPSVSRTSEPPQTTATLSVSATPISQGKTLKLLKSKLLKLLL